MPANKFGTGLWGIKFSPLSSSSQGKMCCWGNAMGNVVQISLLTSDHFLTVVAMTYRAHSS